MNERIEYAERISERAAAAELYKRMEKYSRTHTRCRKCNGAATVIVRSVSNGGAETLATFCKRCADLEAARARLRRMLAE